MRARCVALAFGCVVVAGFAAGTPPKEFTAGVQAAGSVLALRVPVGEVASARLVVTGPGDFRVERTFLADEPIGVDLSHVTDAQGRPQALADGDYKWELWVFTPVAGGRGVSVEREQPDVPGASGSPGAALEPWLAFGRFLVEQGTIAPLEEPQRQRVRTPVPAGVGGTAAAQTEVRENVPGAQRSLGGQSGASAAQPESISVRPLTTFAGMLYNSDSICAGCANGDFDLGSGELLLKSAWPWLTLRDIGVHGAQVPNDQLWRWVTLNGPLSLVQARLNTTGATLPMTVERDTPSNTLYVAANGAVGIGTSTPSSGPVVGLDIVKPGLPGLRLVDTTGGAHTWALWAGTKSLGIFDETAVHNPFMIDNGAPDDALHIVGSGNVGIGTATPNFLLHAQVPSNTINGVVATSSDASGTGAGALFGAIANWGSLGFQVHGSARTISRYGITLGGWAEINQASGGNGLILATRTATPLVFATNTTERLRILSNGNVGIGTTAPAGTLDVNGSIYQRGGVLFADRVFEPGYKLESIEEHQRFAWEHKRLPGIAGRTVDGEGREVVELGASQRGIVEELEKAHIYIGQLNDELKAKDRQLGELSQRLEALAGNNQQMTALRNQVHTLNEKLDRLAERVEKHGN